MYQLPNRLFRTRGGGLSRAIAERRSNSSAPARPASAPACRGPIAASGVAGDSAAEENSSASPQLFQPRQPGVQHRLRHRGSAHRSQATMHFRLPPPTPGPGKHAGHAQAAASIAPWRTQQQRGCPTARFTEVPPPHCGLKSGCRRQRRGALAAGGAHRGKWLTAAMAITCARFYSPHGIPNTATPARHAGYSGCHDARRGDPRADDRR